MDDKLKDKIESNPLEDQTPPPGMHKVTDMDTGEVAFEKDKTPEDYEREAKSLMDFADGSDGGANSDGSGA